MFQRVSLITISSADAPQRLDNFLFRTLKGVPKSRIYRLIRQAEIRVNKKRVPVSYRLEAGDLLRLPPIRVAIPESRPETGLLQFWAQQLQHCILEETADWVIFNKPEGLAVHGGSGIEVGAIEAIKAYWPHAQHWELAHRLDRETSGCLWVAKKRSALRQIQQLWQVPDAIQKRYHALLLGSFGRGRRIQVPLKKTVRGQERIVLVDPEGKQACTDFEVIHRYASVTLAEARLQTGRTHQIRVHAQYMGHPILGDDKYASEESRFWAQQWGLSRLFLHAHQLSFTWEGKPYTIEAPYDAVLEKVVNQLNKGDASYVSELGTKSD